MAAGKTLWRVAVNHAMLGLNWPCIMDIMGISLETRTGRRTHRRLRNRVILELVSTEGWDRKRVAVHLGLNFELVRFVTVEAASRQAAKDRPKCERCTILLTEETQTTPMEYCDECIAECLMEGQHVAMIPSREMHLILVWVNRHAWAYEHSLVRKMRIDEEGLDWGMVGQRVMASPQIKAGNTRRLT